MEWRPSLFVILTRAYEPRGLPPTMLSGRLLYAPRASLLSTAGSLGKGLGLRPGRRRSSAQSCFRIARSARASAAGDSARICSMRFCVWICTWARRYATTSSSRNTHARPIFAPCTSPLLTRSSIVVRSILRTSAASNKSSVFTAHLLPLRAFPQFLEAMSGLQDFEGDLDTDLARRLRPCGERSAQLVDGAGDAHAIVSF